MSDDWKTIDTAPRDGTVVKIKVDIVSVRAYFDYDLDRWVLTHPLHMESVFRPTRWKPDH